jgi:hypothetical protein
VRVRWTQAHAAPVQGTALALVGLVLASLRVRCGLHTWPQVRHAHPER